jgi:drug/metabolite transporter (DMT)-like permease
MTAGLNKLHKGVNVTPAGWVLLAISSHLAWGIYPVLARYMQKVSLIPPMTFVTLGYSIVMILLITRMHKYIRPSLLRQPTLWVFAVIVAIRGLTGVLAVGYTKAMYVQLLNLMAPFFVVLLSATFFKDSIPRFTVTAITFSIIGAVLMMSNGEISGIQWQLSASDWVGIILSAVSSFALALYMIIVRRGLQHALPGEVIFFVQALALVISSFALSMIWHNNWGRWEELGWLDWLVFGCYVVIALLFANTGQILSLKHLSAPLVSSFLSLRLVGTVIGGMIILGEKFTTIWQVIGTIIVLVTLTLYLWFSKIHGAQDHVP